MDDIGEDIQADAADIQVDAADIVVDVDASESS
jgi:hypothetical protein